jgi:serine phosphatase RsbU (regulator of sigma subunit)/anti-sigma regulatory factor (Ser/Thr protein kinase)
MSAIIRTLFRRGSKTAGRAAAPTQPPATPQAASLLPAGSGAPIEIPPSDPLFAHCLSVNGAFETDDLSLPSEALATMRQNGIKVVLPLVTQGELIGVITLGPRLSDQDYSSEDLRLLSNLASQAAVSLRVAQLVRQQQSEAARRERMEQELRVAGIIQQTLLPREIPTLRGFELAAHWQPARAVGGDFYDFISLPGGRLAIIIGDVTDKGIPAALVMASTRSILRSTMERLQTPGDVLTRVNDVLWPDMPAKMFVTCLMVVLDPNTGHIRYANAGHNPGLQRTLTGVVELRARGMPLGLMPGMQYEEKEASLQLGDSLLLYSDGLTEAHNPAREMFGTPRLQQALAAHPGGPELIEHLRRTLFAFVGDGWEQEDDVTLVVLRHGSFGSSRSTQHTDRVRILAHFTLASEPGNERRAAEQVEQAIGDLNLSKARLERLKTAVAETTLNAMEHGNKFRAELPVDIRVMAIDAQLSVFVTDQGRAADIPEFTAPDIDAKLQGIQSPRGWGLFLIRNMVDEMHHTGDESQHTVQLVMNLEREPHGNRKI